MANDESMRKKSKISNDFIEINSNNEDNDRYIVHQFESVYATPLQYENVEIMNIRQANVAYFLQLFRDNA